MDNTHDPAPLAVIGAGLAGSIAARHWLDAGQSAVLFDKGRGPGGRMSTRRSGPYDHGAQYFTVQSDAFAQQVAAWRSQGVVAPWSLRLGVSDGAGLRAKQDDRTRYVGTPGMSSVIAHITEGLDVHFNARVTSLEHQDAQFILRFEDGSERRARRVVLALPAPQAADLLGLSPVLQARAQAVTMAPCWSVMAEFRSRLPVDFDGLFVNEGPVSWAARDSSKPGRGGSERWVLHGSTQWTQSHLEDDPSEVITALVAALGSVTGCSPEVVNAQAHRWRYARCLSPLQESLLFDASVPGLAVAGDWCAGDKVEGAYSSGVAAAAHLLNLSARSAVG